MAKSVKEDIMNVDFETFSRCEIKFGSFRYAEDESTEILCIAYGKTEDDVELWYPGMPKPRKLLAHIKKGGLIKGWNVTFEYAIFNHVGTRLGWPKIKIEQTRCTQADALALALPASLDQAAAALGSDQQKDKKGKALITKLCKPRKPTKNKLYDRVTPEIDPEAFEDLYKYCIQDVKTEMSIGKMLPKIIKERELDLMHLTLKINERGIPVDTKLLKIILKTKAEYTERLNLEIEKITEDEEDEYKMVSTNSRLKALKWLEKEGLKLDAYAKADISGALRRTDVSSEVRRFLEIRAELSRTPIKKFDFLAKALCKDGTLKNNLIFNKATTGRYAGAGFQIHNLPRDSSDEPNALIKKFMKKEFKGMNVYNEAIKLIRPILCAPVNQKLVISDFSSIENRVLAWLAGDKDTLKDFKNGVDQYIKEATGIYKKKAKDITKDERQLGKIAVLGCGFGAGWKTFMKVCAEQWGVFISEEQSKDIVNAYRERNWKVVKMWYALYEEAMNAIIYPGRVFTFGLIKFRMADEFLYMRLPSGRLLAYYKPELRKVMTPWGKEKLAITHMGNNTYTRKWERLTIIPGRLTENVVQAVARDFLTDAMFRVEDAGYPLIGCVHDENISLVEKVFGSIEEYDKLMEIIPDWAIGCPINSEGYEGKRYKK